MKRCAFVAAMMSASAAYSAQFDGAYVGCVTQDALSEMQTAIMNQDRRQYDTLMGAVCAPLDGFEFSVVERGMLRSKVRVYVGDNSVLLWTVSEAVRDAR